MLEFSFNQPFSDLVKTDIIRAVLLLFWFLNRLQVHQQKHALALGLPVWLSIHSLKPQQESSNTVKKVQQVV